MSQDFMPNVDTPLKYVPSLYHLNQIEVFEQDAEVVRKLDTLFFYESPIEQLFDDDSIFWMNYLKMIW